MTSEKIFVNVSNDKAGLRLDKYLVLELRNLTRSKIQKLIANHAVKINEIIVSDASFRVKEADKIEVDNIKSFDSDYSIKPENIDFEIIFEDDDILVINKPIGLSVHPGAGLKSGTLANAIAHHIKQILPGDPARPGIVHRLDKDTSGLMVVAKSELAHKKLSEAIANRSMKRIYNAIVYGVLLPNSGIINTPFGRSKVNRTKMTVKFSSSRDAITHYKTLSIFKDSISLLEIQLDTGRTHQIRVHMEFKKTPIIGDQTYGKSQNFNLSRFENNKIKDAIRNFPRQALHAKKLEFIHPINGKLMSFETDLPADIKELINLLSL